MVGMVADVSSEDSQFIIHTMPLRLVYAYEHYYFWKNGYQCRVLTYEESLEQIMNSV